MARLIAVDGTETEVSPENGKSFDYKELQRHVGGYAEAKKSADGWVLWDEEAHFKKLEHNPKGSSEARRRGAISMLTVIFGPVLICSDEEMGD